MEQGAAAVSSSNSSSSSSSSNNLGVGSLSSGRPGSTQPHMQNRLAEQVGSSVAAEKDRQLPWSCGAGPKARLCSHSKCSSCFQRSVASDPRLMRMYADRTPARKVGRHSASPISWRCDKPECGHPFSSPPKTLSNPDRRGGCPYCARTGPTRMCEHDCLFCFNKSIASLPHVSQFYAGNKPAQTITKASTEKVEWRCNRTDCQHQWEAMPHDMTQRGGSGCPRCSKTAGEKVVCEILTAEQGSKFGHEWSPPWLHPKRFDFNVNHVSLFEPSPCLRAVEVDGMHHFEDFSGLNSRQRSLMDER